MDTKGYGIVGVGYFGAELGRIVNALEGARVVAVLDPENGEKIALEYNCELETDLDTICARKDIDAIIVATPNYLHKEPVLAAARHKKNVFCEKPIALSYADCDQMVNTCKNNSVMFMAGHVMNFFNGVRKAKELINKGAIGEILCCHSARNGWEPPQNYISWKKFKDKSGGHLYHHIHELDCIQFLMGPASAVTMIGGNVAHKEKEFSDEDDMMFLSIEFENNTYAICEYGSAFRWAEHYLLINGTKGAIKIDMKDVSMTVKDALGRESKYLVHETKEEDDDRTRIYHDLDIDGAIMYGMPGKKPPLWLHGIMKKEMTYFNSLLHGATIDNEFKPLLTGDAARASIATADAATLSLKENRKVSVAEVMK
ncbi:MAG: Gfo/Idh/MocA family oxidoreductase [Sphaerochaeta sp.]|nr:Gfo/Idh/MocA family oxidoreductase [Sphaerochaeta sp.]